LNPLAVLRSVLRVQLLVLPQLPDVLAVAGDILSIAANIPTVAGDVLAVVAHVLPIAGQVRLVAGHVVPIATQIPSIARGIALIEANVAVGALGAVDRRRWRRSGRSAGAILGVQVTNEKSKNDRNRPNCCLHVPPRGK